MPPKPLRAIVVLILLPLVSFGQWVSQQSPTTFEINDIQFLTESLGFLGTDNSVYKTVDGGQTWTSPQYPGGTSDLELLSSSYVLDMHFFDQSNGLMVGSGFFNAFNIVGRTTDGGATWRLVYNQGVAGDILMRTPLTSIAFKDSNTGYVVGGSGTILKTTDAGATWNPIISPTSKDLRKVLFIDSQTGLIAGDKVLLKTTNEGTTWQPISMSFSIYDLHFLSASIGIATTYEGRILRTTDGGATWIEHPIDFEARLGKIAFQGQTGYVIGYEGLFNKFILKTTDGGQVWEKQSPDVVYNLTGINLTPNGKGWVGGTYGKLFLTGNGGGNSYPIASFTSASAFCANKTFNFTNNGPQTKYAYEWRVDGILKSTSYHFSYTFTEGNHVVELKAINGSLTGTTQRSFYVEPEIGFGKSLEVIATSGVCQGSGTTITVKDPEWGIYRLYNGTTLVAEDNTYGDGVNLQTPTLQSTTTFRVTATRSNSCETVEIYKDIAVNVYSDLTQGSSVQLVQNYFCNSGTPAVQVTSSRNYVLYELYSDSKLISSAIGNGLTITLNAPAIQDTTQYKVKARIVGGSCERWFNDVLEVKVETVTAEFHLSTLNAAIGEPVNVYNKSKGANNFQWTFSNASPSTSNVTSPGSVSFSQAGTPGVTLTAKSASGCQDVKSKSIYVYDGASLESSCWAAGVGVKVEGNVTDQELTGLTSSPNGDVLFTGYYLGAAEFDSKAGQSFKTKNQIAITNFLACYGEKGVLRWVLNTGDYTVENSTNRMMGSKVIVGTDGSIYLLANYGNFEPTFHSTDGDSLQPYKDVIFTFASQQFLVKYSPDGIMQWVKSKLEITGDMLSTHFIDLGMDSFGNVYLVNENVYKLSSADGDILSTVSAFDPQQILVHLQRVDFKLAPDGSFYTIDRGGSEYIKIKKHSATGALEWEDNVTPNGALLSYCSYLGSSVSTDGGLVLFGTASQTTEFESQGESKRVLNPNSVFIVRYDANGKIRWLNSTLSGGNIHGTSISMNELGETSVSVKGSTVPTPSGCTLQSQDGLNFTFMPDDSPYIVKFDAAGNIIGINKVYGESMNLYLGVELFTRGDQTYATGWAPNIDVPWTVNGDVLYDQYPHTLFVAKFQNDCEATSAPSITGTVVDVVPGSSICPGTEFNVSYDVAPGVQLEADNKFSVFLVAENGSGLIEVGSTISTALQGTIQAKVPDDVPLYNSYKIRLFASNPKLFSDVIDNQFTIRSVDPPDFIYTKALDLTYRLQPTVGQNVECKWLVEGKTISERMPLYKFSTTGLFEVCLVAKDECGVERTVCKNIYVECSAVPTDYTYTVNDKTVTFKGVTNSSNAFEWNFGDGTKATTINAVHTFATYGEKWVCLKSATECNYGMACKLIKLTCTQGNLAFNFVSAEKTVQFTNNSDADYTQFEWNFGDGTTSTDKNPVHTYPGPGTYYVTLTSAGKCSEVKTLVQNVTVECVIPTADFQTSADELAVTFDNKSLNAGQHHWTFGDGATSDLISPHHTYSSSGSYQVCLTATNGCTQRTICKNVVVSYYYPPAPTGVVATALDRSTISVSWIDNATKESGYWLEYGDGSSPLVILAVLPPNTTNYVATNLSCDKLYTFRVVAMGQANIATSNDADGKARTPGLEKPIVTASAFKACEGQSLELTAPNGFSSYVWSTGQTTQKITVTTTGQYSVSVIENTCRSPVSDDTGISFAWVPVATIQVYGGKIRAQYTVEHYQWYLDDVPIEGSNSQEITPTVTGSYKVELTHIGCSSISESVNFVITGVEESSDHQIYFYPLPADEVLTIVFDDYSLENSPASISLINATSKVAVVASKSPNENKVEIQVSHLTAGVYVCVIEVGETVIHKKVIIY